MQGFSLSLRQMSWAVRRAALLPANIFELTDAGRESLIARRMSGAFPVQWHGQSPRAIRAIPHQATVPFHLVILPETETPDEYKAWADSSPFRPTIVAKAGGDLGYDDLTVDGLQAHFLKICDRLPKEIDRTSVDEAREALKAWKPMPVRQLGYQVGGHNTITPNLVALSVVGFENLVYGRLEALGGGLRPYIDQIVRTSNSVLDERDKVEPREMKLIFREPPDVNLFAPAISPVFFGLPVPEALDREEKRRFETVRHALSQQSGYNFELRTEGQTSAFVGKEFLSSNGKEGAPHPMMGGRALELSLGTETMSALAASELSAVVRLPNEINRTAGTVRNFAEHYRSANPATRKRLLAFRAVQARLASACPSEFLDIVRRSKTGVRVVSDAHLEWLNLDGLPLSLRKNCARVPVTPGNLFVEHLASRPPLQLAPEDFRSILVLSALKRDDPIRGLFEKAFEVLEKDQREKMNITFVDVTSEADLVKAFNEFDGPMVIFDGHGSHEKDGVAKLYLGDEAIDVWDLRGKVRIPPIVVLSACDTHAADRNHATTANGFMSLGARTVLSSVFPLEARAAAIFVARLVLRVGDFLGPAIRTYGHAVTWLEVASGMLRMQLLSDFLRQLRSKSKIDQEALKRIHVEGNMAINGMAPDPFAMVIASLKKIGVQSLDLELETAVANSSVISYLQVGRPETILIDDAERVKAQMAALQLRGPESSTGSSSR